MSFSLEPAPELRGELMDLARRRHLPPQDLLDQAVSEWLASQRASEAASAPPEVSPMLALFAEWDAEDETDDPEEPARRRREWEETRANLEASAEDFAAGRWITPEQLDATLRARDEHETGTMN